MHSIQAKGEKEKQVAMLMQGNQRLPRSPQQTSTQVIDGS